MTWSSGGQKSAVRRTGHAAERKPRPVTPDWLERAALHYLGRYAASEARLREVLIRKIRRRTMDPETPTAEQENLIDRVVEKASDLGYVDDKAYARARARSMIARGKTSRTIRQDLRHKGIAAPQIDEVLEDLADDGLSNREALINLLRRRRFGPFAALSAQPKPQDKQIAALMRAGFAYRDAAAAVSAQDEEALYEVLETMPF